MENPLNDGSFHKSAVFIFSLLIGLGAKLATINRRKALTMKEVIFHSAVAFASAWFMWWLLHYLGKQEYATPCAVICGRWGDAVIISIGDLVRKGIKGFSEYIAKK